MESECQLALLKGLRSHLCTDELARFCFHASDKLDIRPLELRRIPNEELWNDEQMQRGRWPPITKHEQIVVRTVVDDVRRSLSLRFSATSHSAV